MPQYVIKINIPKLHRVFKRPLGPRIGDRRRAIHYVDSRIQGRLIAVIVTLELLLIVAGMIILNHDLHQVIEDQLFRVHPGLQEGMPVLLHHLISALGVIVLANVALVIVIEWFWSCYVAKIVTPLKDLFDSVRFLDLRHKPEPVVDHDVLDKAGDWVQTERLRCAHILQLAEELVPNMDRDEAIKIIAEMRHCLPKKPAEQ